MKFIRRTDLDSRTRLRMALAMLERKFADWGLVSEMARQYGVSRQFLYNNQAMLLRLFTVERAPQERLSDQFCHRLILCLRLYCNGSAHGISRTLAEMGLGPASAGHISEFLRAIAASCSIEIPRKGAPVILLLDEIFGNDKPILIVMEASSHYILRIALMSDRKADTWQSVLERLQELGVDIELLVKDQGSSMKAAALELELPERADLFHLLKPFDPFLRSLERHAYSTMTEQFNRQQVFLNRKTVQSLEKSLAQYEAATAETLKAIQAADNYEYIHKCLHEAFDSFTSDGRVRTRQMAEADIEAAMSLLEQEFPSHKGILAAVTFLRKNLPDYWRYFDQLQRIVLRQARTIAEHALRAGCLAWQLQRKAMAVKSSKCKREFSRQAKVQLDLALAGAGNGGEVAIKALFADLDSNVRSSSPLEAINSIVRNYLNSCRGQTTQEALQMLAFFLNHRKATRGKYSGTSPYERLTGIPETASPIDQLLRLSPRTLNWKSNDSSHSPLPTNLLRVA